MPLYNKKDWEKFVKNKGYLSFKAALFDLDNTLYAYKPCNEFASKNLFKKIAGDLKVPLSLIQKTYEQARKETHQRLAGTASMHSRFLYIQRTLEILLQITDVGKTVLYHDYFWKCYFQKMKLFPWVLPLFRQLKKNGIKISILTNLTSELQFKKCIYLGVQHYIDCLVSSEEAGREKPHLNTFRTVFQKVKHNHENFFIVGDDLKTDISNFKGIKTFIL